MRAVCLDEMNNISGGHGNLKEILRAMGPVGVTTALTLGVLELGHAYIGFKEAYNDIVDWQIKGCNDIDEDDHFRAKACVIYDWSTTARG